MVPAQQRREMNIKGPGLVFKKTMVFLSPFLAFLAGYLCLELFVLPVNYFNYGIWGSLRIGYLTDYIPGFFYPRMHLAAIEPGGDLANRAESAIPKRMDFQTDEYGFRNSVGKAPSCKIVIVGDSYAASGLCAQEMLTGVLGRKLHENIYSFAPSNMNDFLNQAAFQRYSPSIVIFCCVERNLRALCAPLAPLPPGGPGKGWVAPFFGKQWFQNFMVWLDRVLKLPGWHHFYWRIHENDAPKSLAALKTGPLLFLQGDAARIDVPESFTERTADVVESYQKALKERGIRFIVVPVPNKESVYYGFLAHKNPPIYLHKIIKALKKRHIETIDLQTVFEKAAQGNKGYLYYPDDSHWNLAGIEVAANGLVPIIERLEADNQENKKTNLSGKI